MAEGYVARLPNRIVPLRNPENAGAMGMAIAKGVAELGETGQRVAAQDEQVRQQVAESDRRIAELEDRRARTIEASSAAARWAEVRGALPQMLDELPESRADGKVGYQAAAVAAYRQRAEEFLGTIGRPDVREQFEGIVADGLADLTSRAYATERAATLKTQGRNWDVFADTTANTVLSDPTPDAEASAMASGRQVIAALGLDGNAAAGMERGLSNRLATSRLDGLGLQGNWAEVDRLISSGDFDARLTPEQKVAYGRRAKNGMASAATVAAAEIKEQGTLIAEQVNDDVPVDDAVLARLETQFTSMGDEGKAYDMRKARERNRVNTEFKGALPSQISEEIAKLDARIARDGANVDDALVNRRSALQGVLEKRRSQVEDDPLGFAAGVGMNVEPINWAAPDPAAVQRRVMQARSMAQATGFPPSPLRPDELSQLKAAYRTGVNGQLGVLRSLDAIGSGFDRAAAARQVAPEDMGFQHLAQLNPEHRQMVVAGRQAIDEKSDMLKPDAQDRRGVQAVMDRVDGELRAALKAMSPGDAAAVRDTAREWLAGLMRSQGKASVNEMFDEGSYRVAMRVALGGQIRPGGVVTGGIGQWAKDRPYVVPDGFTEPGFAQAVRRDQAGQERGGGGPVDLDGKTAFDLKRAFPVMIAPGRYRWETRGGVVRDRKGGPYISTVVAGQ